MATSPDSVTYPSQGYGILGPLPGYVINVQDVAEVDPSGNDDSYIGLQTALDTAYEAGGGSVLMPPGDYQTSEPLRIGSNVKLIGMGTVRLLGTVPTTYVGSRHFIINRNRQVTQTDRDADMEITNITFDYAGTGAGGGTHAISFVSVDRVRITDCIFYCANDGANAGDAVACQNADNVTISGCKAYDASNCSYDFWSSCTNISLLSCYATTASAAQVVNFNALTEPPYQANQLSSGFTMTGCHLAYTGATAGAMQIEPLSTSGALGCAVENISITGNVFSNLRLVMRGTVRNATVSGNTFNNCLGGDAVIILYEFPTASGEIAEGVVISGNTINDPETEIASGIGVIRCQTDAATCVGNVVYGTGYTAVGFYSENYKPVQIGNYFEQTPTVGYLRQGFRIPNTSAYYSGWEDASGTIPRVYIQSDNNWIMQSTTSTGAARVVWSILARSDNSDWVVSIPMDHQAVVKSNVTASIAAAGTTISTATVLAANFNEVTTCTVGVADGVRLSATTRISQTVTNSSAATLKVYPQNSGAGQIDAGGVGTPVTIAAGKTKTFLQYSTNNYRTVSEF